MTPEQLASSASPIVADLGGAFYFVPSTLARGKELGLDGFRFYFLGRGGVLGNVESKVVTSALGYFNPELVEKMWSSASKQLAPRDAAREYLGCAHQFGREKFSSVPGLDAFCESAEAVVANTDPAALATFAGISAEPRPDDAPARAMQLLATLREMRFGLHLVAIVSTGLSPRLAHQMRRPDMVKGFGWDAELPVTDADRKLQAAADKLTDEMAARSYSALHGGAADAFVATLQALKAAAG